MPYIFDELRDCVSREEPDSLIERMELAESIDRFLAGMDEEDRVMFVRRYWYMDSISDIAERFFVSESKVKSSLFRSRKKLRTHLVKEGIEV